MFEILRESAHYRYQSPVPALKGRAVEGDARRASTLLSPYRGRVKLVITSPPYLDITDYHEDQWLRLWFLGGPSHPLAAQGKDDRHRRIEAYWNFLREAWTGVAPLLQRSAQVVIRIGGTRLREAELCEGLYESLNSTGRRFRFRESRTTTIKNGQRRIFLRGPAPLVVEHDFRFQVA